MKTHRIKYLLFFAVLAGGLYAQEQVPESREELKIERKTRTVPYVPRELLPDGWSRRGEDLFQAKFPAPWGFLDPLTPEPDGKEPTKKKRTARQVLEGMGIVFTEGAKATFNKNDSTLTVILSGEQLELLELWIGVGCGESLSNRISCRAEIYELSTMQVLQLAESAEVEADHKPERDAALRACREKKGKLLAIPTVVTRSGQRSKLVDALGYPALAEVSQAEDETFFVTEERQAGTVFEVDPVTGPDGRTLDIDLSLEYHTAPPELREVTNGRSLPVFHAKSISSAVSITDGGYVLLGTWKPTGKPEYESGDKMHVAFLTACIQRVETFGLQE